MCSHYTHDFSPPSAFASTILLLTSKPTICLATAYCVTASTASLHLLRHIGLAVFILPPAPYPAAALQVSQRTSVRVGVHTLGLPVRDGDRSLPEVVLAPARTHPRRDAARVLLPQRYSRHLFKNIFKFSKSSKLAKLSKLLFCYY